MLMKVAIFSLAILVVSCAPTEKLTKPSQEKKNSTLLASANNLEIKPEEQFPDLADMIEVKEEDIPDGTLVLEVDEPIQEKIPGESMETANNVVFRPLFRYREKQSSRRVGTSNRYKRRYYVPRRSYRPYRSAYYYPYRYSPYRRYYY